MAVVVAYGMILPQAILDAPARLPQPACLAAAALARRGADPARHHGRRRRDRRAVMHMEAGLDTGPWHGRARADRRRDDGRRPARRAGAARRRADGAGAGRAGARRVVSTQSEEGVTYAAKIDKAEARIDWNGRRTTVLRHLPGCRRFPAPVRGADRGRAGRIKILRSVARPGRGAPATCSTIADRRLRRGRGAASRAAARGQGPMRPRTSCAACRRARGLAHG